VFLTDIEPYIVQHGYWAVFVIVLLESAGVPLPGETALLLAAGYAGATGQMHLAWIIIAAAGGAVIGDNIGFWIGRRWGASFLLRYGKYIHLPESRLQVGQFLFKKHGAKIVFFGRFVAFLRVLAALLAGVNHFGWGPFLLYNAAGAIVWSVVMGGGAFLFGDSMSKVSGPLGIIALAIFIGAIVAFMIVIRREERKFEEQISGCPEADIRPLVETGE